VKSTATQRTLPRKPEVANAMQWLSLRELEGEARGRLDPAVYDYFAGGADDEITVRANESAFSRIRLVPRVLRGAGQPDLAMSLLGQCISLPVVIAPTAFHRLAHPEGECATARAAHAAGTLMIVSMASTVAIEDLAASGANLWFQLYIQPDLDFTEAVVRRAEAAGCAALVVTVDSPVFSQRERDLRNGFVDLPPGMRCENLREAGNGEQSGRLRSLVFSSELSWREIEWLRRTTKLKILLKGIVHSEDARIAVECGVDGLLVSNHGGRQLDTVPPAIALLPAIADAISGSVPLLVDGGIRRGTDVVKALALGASAVAIGRPVLWGLAIAGLDGVVQVLEMLRSEVDRALALCGCGSPRDVSRDLIRFVRSEARWPHS
jgi:4-hydroxymandelate oxidase